MEEAKRFLDVVIDEAGSDLGVSVTLIRDSQEQNVELAQHAQSSGGDCALLGFPFNWYPQSPDDVYEATLEVCEAAPELGIMLYASHKFNFGRFHPSGWPLDVLERSAEIDNVVGLKIGLLEPGFIDEAFSRLNDTLVIQFPWERWWPLAVRNFGLQFTGAGAYELFQSPDKPYLVDYFNLLLEGRFDEAKELYWRLTPARLVFEKQFMPTQMIGTYHWPQQKYYQWLVGGNGGFTRQPVMKMVQYEMDEDAPTRRAD
jgi:4-hydroxy-tetrahydrodipicolinate synthase